MRHSIPLILIVFAALLLNTGCNKQDEENHTKIKFAFDLNVDGDPLELEKTYQINGTPISFQAANFYVGGIVVHFENGDSLRLKTQYLLAGIGKTASLENDYPISNIDSVEFFVGVEEDINNQSETDFTKRPSSDPLSIKDPAMHWNWITGYKFVRIDGHVDSDGDGTLETSVSYHLGGQDMLTSFDVNTDIPLQEGTSTITFDFNLAKFLSGVDLSTEFNTHTFDNEILAQKLQDNLRSALNLR